MTVRHSSQPLTSLFSDRDEHPLILHLHIPKTGGTTLNKYIYEQWSTDKKTVAEDGYLQSGVFYFPTGFLHENTESIPDRIRRVLSRDDLRAIVGHFCFGIHRHVTRPWAYVTLLRNPLDRIISLYYHLSPTGAINTEEFTSNSTYKIFENDQTRRIAGYDPSLDRCTKQTLQRAKENLRHFSVVGVTERFDETLILLKRKFGWTEQLVYYLKNVNTRRPSKVTIPRASIDWIKARNEFDCELYEYAKDILKDEIAAQDASFQEDLQRFISIKNINKRLRQKN